MNIFMKLKSRNDFSHNEQIIVDYICEHPDRILNMNTKQLSEETYVSVATIYRLCDKIGVSGFSALKVKISNAMDSYLKDQNFDFDFPIKQYQTHYEIMTKLKEDYAKTIESTFDLFDLDQLRLATSALVRAKHIDVYTSAGNVYFAENFKFQMKEIGVDVNVPVDEYEQRLSAASGDMTHLAIMISFGGRGILPNYLSKIIKERNTPLLLICSPEFRDIEANYVLYISPHENHYRKISSYSTRLSILYILDVLYTCYFERDYNNNLEKKMEYYTTMRRADPR